MRNIIKKCLSVLTPRERLGIIPLVIMMVVGGLLESLGVTLVIPLIAGIMDTEQLTSGAMGAILQAVFGQQDGRTYLALLLGVMIAVFICKNLFLIWRNYQQNKATAKIRTRVQNRLLHYFLTRPYSFYLDADSGTVLRTVATDTDHFHAVISNVLGFFTSLIIAFIMTVVVFAIHPQITVLLAGILLVEYAVIVFFIRPFLQKQGTIYRAAAAHSNGIIIEMVRGIKSIKIGSKEPYFEERYAKDVAKLSHARMVEQSFYAVPQRIIEAVTVSALLAYLLAMLAMGSDMSDLIPILSAFVLAASRILPCVSGISSSVSNSNYYEPALDRVVEIDQEIKREEAECQAVSYSTSSIPEVFESEIRLEGICFTYPNGDTPVLKDACMTIRCNESVGIVGTSGVGKTTLVDVLLGLLESQAGTFTMDGVEVDPVSPAWRSKFAYIPQDVFMLSGTIRNNIVFGQDECDIDEDRVWDALEAAQLADFVRTLKDGLETEVGEAGVRLSGGQIQRLGIARALYTDAPILVFDEATSALDNETEQSLMEAISGIHGTKTLIIIAHRLTTIENCDRVYRVEDGKLVDASELTDAAAERESCHLPQEE